MYGIKAQLSHSCRYFRRILNDDLMSLLFSQVGKLVEHFLCGHEIQRRLHVCILEALHILYDCPENGILGIQKMHVAGGTDRDAQFLANLNDSAIEIAQLLLIIRFPLADQKGVIADRLNFKIIVKACNAL